jgi:hypothetical protein
MVDPSLALPSTHLASAPPPLRPSAPPPLCPSILPLPQINSQRLADLGMGEVSPESLPARRKGQHFTREGMGGLMKKVGGGGVLGGLWMVGLRAQG